MQKMQPAKRNYRVGKSEMLAIVEAETGNYSTETIFQSIVKDSNICSYVVPKYKNRKRKRKKNLKDEN